MKLIVIPSWYYTEKGSSVGTPFREQTKALMEEGSVAAAVLYADLDLRRAKEKSLLSKRSFAVEGGIPTFRLTGLFPPKRNACLVRQWASRYDFLYQDYMKKYGQADLIHARSYLAACAAFSLKQKYNVPYVVSEHSSAFAEGKIKKWLAPLIQNVYDNASARVAVSHGLKKRIQNYTSQAIEVIPNFIDTDFFTSKVAKPTSDIFTFFTLGGFVREKRFDLLLKAFAQLKRSTNKELRLRIGGWGQEEKALKQLCRQLNLEEYVQFPGLLNRGEVLKEMRQANVFVLPSQYETFGVVLIEALATGTPIVAAEHDGSLDIVNEQNGILFSPNNANALFVALSKILKRYQRYKPNDIRQNAVEIFSNRVGVERYKALYQRAMFVSK